MSNFRLLIVREFALDPVPSPISGEGFPLPHPQPFQVTSCNPSWGFRRTQSFTLIARNESAELEERLLRRQNFPDGTQRQKYRSPRWNTLRGRIQDRTNHSGNSIAASGFVKEKTPGGGKHLITISVNKRFDGVIRVRRTGLDCHRSLILIMSTRIFRVSS